MMMENTGKERDTMNAQGITSEELSQTLQTEKTSKSEGTDTQEGTEKKEGKKRGRPRKDKPTQDKSAKNNPTKAGTSKRATKNTTKNTTPAAGNKKEKNTPDSIFPDNKHSYSDPFMPDPSNITFDTISNLSDNTSLDTPVSNMSNSIVDNPDKKKTYNTRNANKVNRVSFATHDGHALTPQEANFIDRYIETGNGRQSVIDAGYKTNHPAQYAQTLLNKAYINEEIKFRLESAKNEAIASAEEIMQYFTDVMRGKIKDQFDMEAPLSERTKAAQELAKRQIDIPNRLAGNDEPTLTIKLDFGQNGGDSAPMKTVEPVQPNIQLDGLTD